MHRQRALPAQVGLGNANGDSFSGGKGNAAASTQAGQPQG
jgi:hypothetical protein